MFNINSSLKASIILVILTVFVALATAGCSSKENFDGKYSGTEKTGDEYDDSSIKLDVLVEDGYMSVKTTKIDEYDEKEEDYDVTKLGAEYKYGKSGKSVYFKTDGGMFELRKLDGKYYGIIKKNDNEIVQEITLKKK